VNVNATVVLDVDAFRGKQAVEDNVQGGVQVQVQVNVNVKVEMSPGRGRPYN